jgi:type IV pilus assembly protein PilE
MSIRQRGFTLLELMIVVVIIAILSALALPSYQYYLLRGRLPVGTQALASTQTLLEAWFQDNRTYLGASICSTPVPLAQGSRTVFTLGATCTATTWTLTATGDASLVGGMTYTLNSSGQQATTAVPAGWTASGSCWVMRKDGSC